MAFDLTAMRAKFKSLIVGSSPVSCTFGAVTLNGLRTVLEKEAKYSGVGSVADSQFGMIFTKTDFTAGVPASGDKLTVGGAAYRVVSTEEDSFGIAFKVNLAPEYPAYKG